MDFNLGLDVCSRFSNADVTDRAAMEKVAAAIEEQLGPVDILVNNAGAITPLGNDWELDHDEWWQTIEINLHGPYICTRAVLPSMMSRRQGRIINVSSPGAHTIHPYATAYCASKAALTNFTNCLAPALKEYGISVFALSPLGPTLMHETLATSPQLSDDRRTRSRRVMEEGQEAMNQSVRMFMFLISGKADALTGRHMEWRDTEADLLSRTEEILRDDLHVLRLRK
jgi:NAD(P)-dependent dehydrogenase (short-subunit alcohol dehydrogenase family)